MAIPVLRLYDTRRRGVFPFEPTEPGLVGMYTCGPTVYGAQHLGNMRSQVVPDVLRRLLLASGLSVTYITNITDVGHLVSDADEGEDKIELAAARDHAPVAEITKRWTDQWANDRRRLGCLEPDSTPRASDHIPEQIALAQALQARGHTYLTDDGLYFDIATFPRYPEFAGLVLDDLATTGRAQNIADKRHPADFALWKLSPRNSQRLQEWNSPWGTGFPGWHLECSAMATRYLGAHIDIHTGGIDHVRVHHTNEIAQSESVLGAHPWVSFWVHNEFLNTAGLKISKSAGDSLTVDSLIEQGINPLAFRYFCLQAHYRQQQSFTFEGVTAADTALRRLVHHTVAARDIVHGEMSPASGSRPRELRDAFWQAITDDLNTPRALSIALAAAREPELSPADRWSLMADFDRILGFSLETATDPETDRDVTEDPRIALRLAERQAAKASRDFATADAIRDELAAIGIKIIDTPAGPRAHRQQPLPTAPSDDEIG